MTEKRLRYLKLSIYIAVSLPVIFIVSVIFWRPDEVSDLLLRQGGEIIGSVMDNLDSVALYSGCCVLVLWLVIAAVASFEKQTPSKHPTD